MTTVKVVVDSSVAIKWVVEEPYSAHARRVLDAYEAGALLLLVPDLFYAEVGNIVWKKQRFQGLATKDADEILAAFRLVSFVAFPSADLLDDAYRLAVKHGRTVYDALYLALSLRESCPWVTADERVVNALASTYRGIVWVAAWPGEATPSR